LLVKVDKVFLSDELPYFTLPARFFHIFTRQKITPIAGLGCVTKPWIESYTSPKKRLKA
jgi:hypothetical protein